MNEDDAIREALIRAEIKRLQREARKELAFLVFVVVAFVVLVLF